MSIGLPEGLGVNFVIKIQVSEIACHFKTKQLFNSIVQSMEAILNAETLRDKLPHSNYKI